MGKGKRVYFYATRDDLQVGLDRFEAKHPVSYALCGYFDEAATPVYPSWVELPHLGTSRSGNQFDDAYLLYPKGVDVPRGTVSQAGREKVTVGYVGFDQAFTCQFGGMYKKEALVGGMAISLNAGTPGEALFKSFSRIVFKGFSSVRGNRLGPRALELFEAGFRLTDDIAGARVCDLAPEGQ